jgi:hypothetical protein
MLRVLSSFVKDIFLAAVADRAEDVGQTMCQRNGT